jgi:N,N-dimethylformamidase
MIYGYSDRFSVAPGERIDFKLSCRSSGTFEAELVRLISADTNPLGPGEVVEPIPSDVSGHYPARFQPIHPGSYIELKDRSSLSLPPAASLHAFVFATLPGGGDQAIVSSFDSATDAGWWLGITDGRVTLRLGDGRAVASVSTDGQIAACVWYSVSASWADGVARVSARPIPNSYNSLLSRIVPFPDLSGEGPVVSPVPAGRLLIAASLANDRRGMHFNGKIEAPSIFGGRLDRSDEELLSTGELPSLEVLAQWDFAADINSHDVATDRVTDLGPRQLHATCVNSPQRGVTGRAWQGRNEVYWHAPLEYGAIRFHSDDLDDAGWQTDVSFTPPESMKSGVYALRATIAGAHTYIPFWVLPPRRQSTSKVLLLFPTATYLAYANQDDVTASGGQAVAGHTPVVDTVFCDLMEHPEFGRSLYDVHPDGSGIAFSSARRPIPTIRPDVRHGTGELWCLAADLQIVHWLHTIGQDFDVATDEDLHARGVGLLGQYEVVLTGTHPEYATERMLDAWEAYLEQGGRAMYLGGNGFYWVIGYHPEKPYLVELRRGEAGGRAWQADAGELYLQTTGERSGLWRNRNRAPNKLFGVGLSAIGFDHSGSFTPTSDWRHPSAAFITAGCEDASVIGDHGLVGGGAAGSELDRYDLRLGTPPHALLLASSDGSHTVNYALAPEEAPFLVSGMDGQGDHRVRADLVYFTTRRGGAVFSASSITWCSSLSHNGYDNDVQRLTANVLRAFAAEGGLPPVVA